MGGLQQQKFILLFARNLKSSTEQACTPSEESRGESSCLCQFLVAAGIPWLVAASLQL